MLVDSDTDSVFSKFDWLLESIIRVSSDEILKQELGVSEIRSIIVVALSMTSDESLLEISRPPDPFLHFFTSEHVLSLPDEFISSHLNVLIEQVASQHLLSVLVINGLGMEERVSEDCLGDEVEVLVVEEVVIVVQEQETSNTQVDAMVLDCWIIDVQVSHIIIPLWIMGIKEHGLQWELWSNSLDDIKEIEHLLDGLVSLLSHASVAN